MRQDCESGSNSRKMLGKAKQCRAIFDQCSSKKCLQELLVACEERIMSRRIRERRRGVMG